MRMVHVQIAYKISQTKLFILNYLYLNNKMFLCLSDVKQPSASSELKKNLKESENFRLFMGMRI